MSLLPRVFPERNSRKSRKSPSVAKRNYGILISGKGGETLTFIPRARFLRSPPPHTPPILHRPLIRTEVSQVFFRGRNNIAKLVELLFPLPSNPQIRLGGFGTRPLRKPVRVHYTEFSAFPEKSRQENRGRNSNIPERAPPAQISLVRKSFAFKGIYGKSRRKIASPEGTN